jgi:hypothetical protein
MMREVPVVHSKPQRSNRSSVRQSSRRKIKRLPQTETAKSESGFFQPYSEFAKNLRTWFLAYGIGAPALLISNQNAWTALKQSGGLKLVATLFLIGVAFQIAQALLYKHAMWHLYYAELEPSHKKTWLFAISDKLSYSHVFEIATDVGTVLVFSAATVFVLLASAA